MQGLLGHGWVTTTQHYTHLQVEDLQEQVAYWSTRLAVAERALADARGRQVEREQVLKRLEEAGYLRRSGSSVGRQKYVQHPEPAALG